VSLSLQEINASKQAIFCWHMHYAFRDTCYQGTLVRHIKALDFDSHGPFIAPTTQLHVIRRFIERTQANTVVVVMTGQGRTLTMRNAFMLAFEHAHPLQPDACYTWQLATYTNPLKGTDRQSQI
jgi:hypothetical protein